MAALQRDGPHRPTGSIYLRAADIAP
jgi:hypothetical protein